MPSKTPVQRLDRLEQVVQILAEDQLSLQKIVADLATETRRGFDQVAAQFKETDQRIRQNHEYSKQVDERVDKLVLAIGEFIRRSNTP